MNRRASPRSANLRRALAQEAARIMAQHGIHDFLTAKRKAAERLGVVDASALPRNTEIEEALAEYQRLFNATDHEQTLHSQRRAALDRRPLGPFLLCFFRGCHRHLDIGHAAVGHRADGRAGRRVENRNAVLAA